MEKWSLRIFGHDATYGGVPLTNEQVANAEQLRQYEILHYGRRVGYVGMNDGAPILLLGPRIRKLRLAEVKEAVEFILSQHPTATIPIALQRELGPVYVNKQRQVADDSGDSGDGRHANQTMPLPGMGRDCVSADD